MIAEVMELLAQIVLTVSGKSQALSAEAAIDQDLAIYGHDADDLVEALCEKWGDWIAEWPWHRFVNFSEAPAMRSIYAFWARLGWPGADTAFPSGKLPAERLELSHIAAVIEKGQWFDP